MEIVSTTKNGIDPFLIHNSEMNEANDTSDDTPNLSSHQNTTSHSNLAENIGNFHLKNIDFVFEKLVNQKMNPALHYLLDQFQPGKNVKWNVMKLTGANQS